MKDMIEISELKRSPGRPKKLEDRTATQINLTKKHREILDSISDSVGGRGEVIRLAIEDLANDKKYTRLLKENLMLTKLVENLKKELRDLKRKQKMTDKELYEGQVLDRARRAFGNRLDDQEITYSPLWIETCNRLKVSNQKLKELIGKGV